MLRSGGLDAALDVTITHPLQNLTVAEAAITPGHAMSVAYERKMRGAGELCRGQGIAFIPIVAESLGGLHGIAAREIQKIGAALARPGKMKGRQHPTFSPALPF